MEWCWPTISSSPQPTRGIKFDHRLRVIDHGADSLRVGRGVDWVMSVDQMIACTFETLAIIASLEERSGESAFLKMLSMARSRRIIGR